MKLYEILSEDHVDYGNLPESDPVYKRIKNECKQFIKESEELPLFRGMNNPKNKNYIETFDNRIPLSSEKSMVAMFNLYVEERFGIENVRVKNSVFAVGNDHNARGYGKIHFMFPIDDYKFVWSPVINDLYDNQDWLSASIAGGSKVDYTTKTARTNFNSDIKHIWPDVTLNNVKNHPDLSVAYKKIKPYIMETFDDQKYTDKDLGAALSTGYEIMFQTKAYYVIEMLMGVSYEKHLQRIKEA